MVRLAIHSLTSTEAAAITSLAIAAELIHVISIVRIVVVGVIVWIATRVSGLGMWLVHMLTLRSRSSRMLTTQCRVWCGVATVLGLIVSALALLKVVRSVSSRLRRNGTSGL